MSCYHITMEQGHKVARPITSEAEYRSLRNNPTNIKKLELARNGNKRAKMALLQINYSCVPQEQTTDNRQQTTDCHAGCRLLKGSKTPSNSVGMDVDFDPSAPDYEQKMKDAPAMILSMKDELGLLMLERSVNKGYHLVFRRHWDLTQEENLRWASNLLGIEFDAAAKDITRVFFTTSASPEDLIYLDDALFETTSPQVNESTSPQVNESTSQQVNESTSQQGEAQSVVCSPLSVVEESYLGIPYAQIISKWWEMFYDGKTPIKSNRDVLTYELAYTLRHICGFDEELMDKVIPCYDGFSHEQKMKCIRSALQERRTQMPTRLKMVLQELRNENMDNKVFVDAVDEAQLQDDLYYFNLLPLKAMPMGVRDSLDAVDPKMAMAVLMAITPAIGMLATGVKLMVHGVPNTLNLISYIAGKAASGKGQIDPIINAWMHEIQLQDDLYCKQEEEWRIKKQNAKNKKEQPEEPKYPVRFLTLNNTVANLAKRLANTDGTHAFSFTPEADTVASKWKSSMTDFSVMIRQAYDGSRYDREARSADAVTVHIKRLLWNITMCGTPDALYRVITNYTDGLLSRLAIARMPDNTFAALADNPLLLCADAENKIIQIASLLTMMQGTLDLDKLEEKSREWVEEIRLQAVKNYDTVMADARLRDHVIAMRMTAAIILCGVAEKLIKKHGFNGAKEQLKLNPELACEMAKKLQTDEMLKVYEILADSILENDLYFFREKIENVYNSSSGFGFGSDRSKRGRNDTVYSRLPVEFTMQQALAEKGESCSSNSVKQMLKNWRNQGLIEYLGNLRYRKMS
ncbi:MAG: DUF3987 domain-containing protein [Bacteroidaceae bacterium]|nr:DUF3987 domain-containing protein [Bacteroidaceae bacterium]